MSRALIVVDYQTDFVTGSLGSPAAVSIEENIVSKIEEYLGRKERIFFTMDTHDAGYLRTDEGIRIPAEHCIKGTPGWHIFGNAAKYLDRGETIEKSTFGSLDIIGPLKGFDEIELCGVATNICVMVNALILKTAYPDAKVIIDPDCVASYDGDLHRKALEIMKAASIDILSK